MLIKVCGITTLEDARWALSCGANALGFNFYPPSPRYIEAVQAARILEELPGSFLGVGVYVGNPRTDPPAGIDAIQLHGVQHEKQIASFGRRVLAATELESVSHFPNLEIVIDHSWGKGVRADWKALAGLNRPFILSGGLTPENVASAIRLLSPSGVDVCSGVESTPGRKSPVLVERFVQAALGAARETIPHRRGTDHATNG